MIKNARKILFVMVTILAASTAALPATAQTTIKIGYTQNTGLMAGWIGIEKGFFKQNGIDATAEALKNGGVVAPGLVANEIQLGTLTPSVVLQAYDGGIKLKFITAATNLANNSKDVALVARNNVKLEKPQDYLGKSYAVGALNSSGYMFLRYLMRKKGVDPNGAKYVEVGLSQMADVVRSGGVDAGLMFSPAISTSVATGQMYVAEYVAPQLPNNLADTGFAVSEDWAKKNPQAIIGIRKALQQATEWSHANHAAAWDIVAKYLNMKRETLDSIDFPNVSTKMDEADIKWWMDVMKADKMLRTDFRPKDVLLQ